MHLPLFFHSSNQLTRKFNVRHIHRHVHAGGKQNPLRQDHLSDMLNIKPLIGFSEDGQLISVAKVRGRKAVQPKLVELLLKKQAGGRRYNIAVANGGVPEEMEELAKKMKESFPAAEHFWEGELDATLSTYIGSGVLGACIQFLD